LDDPTKGIDLQAKADLFSMIRQLLKTGVSIILYSSEDVELLNNTDRVLVFHGGEITRELVGDERTEFNLYQAAFGDSAKLAL
jgi:ribose transport system ATP-binding protein